MPEGGPSFGEVADPIGVWVDEHSLFVWDAYVSISMARVYDAPCNRWIAPALPPDLPSGFTFDRRYGISAFGGKILVYGPTWEAQKGNTVPPGPFRVLLFDTKRKAWLNVSPPPESAGRESRPFAGEGKLILVDASLKKTSVFDSSSERWQVADAPSFAGASPGIDATPACSFIGSGAWDLWAENGHQHLDFTTLRWTLQSPPGSKFQRCLVSSLRNGEKLVAPMLVGASAPSAGSIVDTKSLAHTEIPTLKGESIVVFEAGGEIWARAANDSKYFHFDRGSKQWSPIALPPSKLPGKSVASFRFETLGSTAVLLKIDPPPVLMPGQPEPAPAKVEAWAYQNGSFGKAIELGRYNADCDIIQQESGELCKFDKSSFHTLDPISGRIRRSFPISPIAGYLRRMSPTWAVAWGILQRVSGTNCGSPSNFGPPRPDQPVCTPSQGRIFTHASKGGMVFRFQP